MITNNRSRPGILPLFRAGALGLIGISIFFIITACKEKNQANPTAETEKNTTYIDNPGTPPSTPRILELQEEISIGNPDNEHTFFADIGDIDVDEQGNIYVLEKKKVGNPGV